jgi:hypothetical protein
MTNARLEVTAGSFSFVGEGDQEWLTSQFDKLLDRVEQLSNLQNGSGEIAVNGAEGDSHGGSGDGTRSLQGTTNDFASRLQAKNAKNLALAAAAHLSLVKEKPSFARNELLDEMKSATPFYKKTMANNLSKTLESLQREGAFTEVSSNKYALAHQKLQDLKARLAR